MNSGSKVRTGVGAGTWTGALGVCAPGPSSFRIRLSDIGSTPRSNARFPVHYRRCLDGFFAGLLSFFFRASVARETKGDDVSKEVWNLFSK